MGLFSVMNVGTKGLSAAQLGMDIAGQNISNADVEGYSRKRLNLTPDYRYDAQFGQMGFGVDVVNIERQRDKYIDEQIQRQNQELGTYEEVNAALDKIENLFTEPSDTGLLHYMDQFFDAWQNLSLYPADPAARTMVRSNANILVDVFHNLSSEMKAQRDSINSDISGRVDKVNQLSKEIYGLNQEIALVEVNAQNANDSRDKRDQLLKELSKLVDITVTENNLGQISVSTAGSLIVSPVFYQELETTTRSFRQPDGSTFSDIGIRFKSSKQPYMPLSGQIKGLFDARDKVLPEYQNYLDTLAKDLVSKVNEIHERGFNLMGYTGFQFFDPSLTGASDMKISNTVLSNIQNIATAGAEGAKPGSDAFAAGALVFGNPPVNFSHRNLLQGTVRVMSGAVVLRDDIDYHIDHVNGTIQMLNNIYDASAITVDYEYDSGSFKGAGDNSVAIAIAQLRQNATMNRNAAGVYTASYTEYYSTFVGRLGLAKQESASNVDTRSFLIEQYQSRQDSIAGVSLDEEMANMSKNQHSYAAAARLISIADEMLNVLLNM